VFGQGNLLSKVHDSRRLESGLCALSLAAADADQGFPGLKNQHKGGSDVLCLAGPPVLAEEKGEDLIADKFSSKQIPEEPVFYYNKLRS
jgi:hypothetical protein